MQNQPENSIECSIASVKMIMDYQSDDIAYTNLVEDLSPWINESERHLEGVVLFLAKRKYDVSFIQHDLNVIDKTLDGVTEKAKEKFVKALKHTPKNDKTYFRRKKLELAISCIEAGGNYSTAIPTFDLLDSNLQKGIPTIIGIKLRIWNSDPTNGNNHSVVVTGKEGQEYIINDPGFTFTEPYKIKQEKLLMAWYATGAYTLYAIKKPRDKTPRG